MLVELDPFADGEAGADVDVASLVLNDGGSQSGDAIPLDPSVGKRTELQIDNGVLLLEEGFDLAVRIGDLPDSTLMSRKVGEVRRMLVASPDFLARNGGGPGSGLYASSKAFVSKDPMAELT